MLNSGSTWMLALAATTVMIDGFVYLSYVVVDHRDCLCQCWLYIRGDGQRRGFVDNVIIVPAVAVPERASVIFGKSVRPWALCIEREEI